MSYRTEVPIKEDLLKADIIYSTIIHGKGDDLEKDGLGYAVFTKKSSGVTEFEGYAPIRPFYLDASSIIFLDKQGYYGSVNGDTGKLVIYADNSSNYCNNLLAVDYFPFQGNIAYSDGTKIELISRNDCSVIKNFVGQDDLTNFDEDLKIDSFSYISDFSISHDGNIVIFRYGNHPKLYKISLYDKKVEVFADIGDNPNISPDGKWVVYLAPDGIRIKSIDGKIDRNLVKSNWKDPEGDFYIDSIPPRPLWSPDNKKLIYHKCINAYCTRISDYDIFLLSVEDGKETDVIKAGLYPSWNYFIHN
jgi:hypothetical protein